MHDAGLDGRRVRFCSVQGHSDLRMAHAELAADRNARSPNFTEEARFSHALKDEHGLVGCLAGPTRVRERQCRRFCWCQMEAR